MNVVKTSTNSGGTRTKLTHLKEASVEANQIWRAAMAIKDNPQCAISHALRRSQRMNDEYYTNELHTALL